MPYKFQILGPLRVFRDGGPVATGPPKRRALVAALLLEPNRAVPLDALAAAMWPEQPPSSAATNVRSHATALRRILGDRLVTSLAFYALERLVDAWLGQSPTPDRYATT